MSDRGKLTFLGTGSSGGVPRVGNDWGDCDPANPRNRRRRCCVLLDVGNLEVPDECTRVLIDSSPDLREQLLDAHVKHLDALVYTHDHADQSHGIDDVRALALSMRHTIPTYMDSSTAETLASRFAYCFEGRGGYPPILDRQPDIEPGRPFTIDGTGPDITLLPVKQLHGRIISLGFRIGDLAYCNDLHDMPEESLALLEGVDTLILDALRYTPHPSHAHLERAMGWMERINPGRGYLTNLHIDLDYETLCAELPSHIRPAFDGLEVEFQA
ncbi:MBL fold metallo-hydrolase [Henriciella litoralis]|uniref:MBL fold metallo-hydrolase n=1 Tax=Henriciella litoralis TaxID=568102 RepID=UPI000A058E35|nr:MBL fold metallo-hydrolase [Henriciella litoralis]